MRTHRTSAGCIQGHHRGNSTGRAHSVKGTGPIDCNAPMVWRQWRTRTGAIEPGVAHSVAWTAGGALSADSLGARIGAPPTVPACATVDGCRHQKGFGLEGLASWPSSPLPHPPILLAHEVGMRFARFRFPGLERNSWAKKNLDQPITAGINITKTGELRHTHREE